MCADTVLWTQLPSIKSHSQTVPRQETYWDGKATLADRNSSCVWVIVSGANWCSVSLLLWHLTGVPVGSDVESGAAVGGTNCSEFHRTIPRTSLVQDCGTPAQARGNTWHHKTKRYTITILGIVRVCIYVFVISATGAKSLDMAHILLLVLSLVSQCCCGTAYVWRPHLLPWLVVRMSIFS